MKRFLFLIPILLISCGKGIPELSHTGICDGYSDWETSDYNLPWATGSSQKVTQSNCGPASHVGTHRYAYDFDMPIGTQIHAARAGTVTKVEESKEDGNGCAGGANYIAIEHSDGTVAEYVHLTKDGALVAVGAAVAQGAAIGISGNTGCSSSAHLHFSVFRDDKMADTVPLTFRNTTSNARGLIEGKSYTAN